MLQQLRGLCNPNKFRRLFHAGTVYFSEIKSTDDFDLLKTNPYYEKYSDKIKNVPPDEFKSKLKAKERSTKAVESKKYSQLGAPKPDITCSNVKRNTLDSIIKMDLIKNKSSSEISDIWREYHKKQDKISAIIPAKIYSTICQRAKEFPVFVYPLPRGDGYEFIMAQFENDDCHFTSLLNYQAYKENAPECLSIFHYTDLIDEKGIVLMRGEYDNSLNVIEAQFLANQMKLYYMSTEKDPKFTLLKTFTHQPDSFKHMDLIKELQNTTFQL
uniref:ATP synthase mitochondrial F1 complex assembly factor 1 n=1 Tax=Strigamia maritima TaxID=126957 RepID=T1IH23_STRMM